MKIGITYNLKSEVEQLEPSQPRVEDMFEEFDSPETIDALCGAIEKMGHECVRLGFGRPAIEKILNSQIDFVFNIAEGCQGCSREAHIPALLEMLDIRYSGPGPLAAGLSLDKISAKKIAAGSGAATPEYFAIFPGQEFKTENIRYPLILKPAYEGSSIGIRQDSKVENDDAFRNKLNWLRANYPLQPVMAERFIGGREFTVAVIGNTDPEILGIMEVMPQDGDLKNFIYSLEVKRDYLQKVRYSCPPKVNKLLREQLGRAALHLFRAFNCRDVSRFDFRTDEHETPYFLEVNTLPGLHPVSSDIVIMARLKGMEYDQLIERIFKHALERYN
ncbi:MAG: ATP-grasp domain-containing protein [Candidatus Margulisbacteria bacterium]|nr:ATP-grasp domain-containing protein [Candidatus Margulisiibacteriota bacterium]